jgi:hypothetical protein
MAILWSQLSLGASERQAMAENVIVLWRAADTANLVSDYLRWLEEFSAAQTPPNHKMLAGTVRVTRAEKGEYIIAYPDGSLGRCPS